MFQYCKRCELQGKSRRHGIVAEHLYCIKRKFFKIFADIGEFFQYIISNGNHMASYGVCLENIQ